MARLPTNETDLVLAVLETIQFPGGSTACIEAIDAIKEHSVSGLWAVAKKRSDPQVKKRIARSDRNPEIVLSDEDQLSSEAAHWVEWLGIALIQHDCINPPRFAPRHTFILSEIFKDSKIRYLHKEEHATWYYPKAVLLDGCRRYLKKVYKGEIG